MGNVKDAPSLPAAQLQDQHIVMVIVRFEATRARRRQVQIRSNLMAQIAHQLETQDREWRPVAISIGKQERRAACMLVVHNRRVCPLVVEAKLAVPYRLAVLEEA